jgi:hypothetical protein
MKLNDLIEQLKKIADETNSSGHTFVENGGDVLIWTDEEEFKIKSIEPSHACGCGCWVGAIINLEKKKEK